jgi:hypothetical protein
MKNLIHIFAIDSAGASGTGLTQTLDMGLWGKCYITVLELLAIHKYLWFMRLKVLFTFCEIVPADANSSSQTQTLNFAMTWQVFCHCATDTAHLEEYLDIYGAWCHQQLIHIFYLLFLYQCQWQQPDSNSWPCDDVASVLPLFYCYYPTR